MSDEIEQAAQALIAAIEAARRRGTCNCCVATRHLARGQLWVTTCLVANAEVLQAFESGLGRSASG